MPLPIWLADVTLTPDPSQLPGGGTLQQLTNGIGGWALILALVGLVIGAAPISRAASPDTRTARRPTNDWW
jgi:hypothetical protein